MLRGSESTVTIGNASAVLLPANARRVAIFISAPITGTLWITNLATAAAGVGISIAKLQPPTLLSTDDVGDWFQRQLNAIAPAGNETIGIIEVLEP
jgi:hypothetical protein